MEEHELTELAEENLQDVTGGLDKNTKIGIGVGAGAVAALGVGTLALATRKPGAAQQVAGAVQHASAPAEYIHTPVARPLSETERNSPVGTWVMSSGSQYLR
jgi:hypothetical protein